MRSLSRFFLFAFLLASSSVFAHDVTLTGTQSFASLDGSAADHDGAANGVFTVSDGNLVVNGVVNCNDDTGASDSACAMAFAVSGNLSVNAGGALYAENRTGSGTGGAITLTVGGNLALSGNAVVSTASRSSSGSTGGAITANVGGSVSMASGTTIDSGSANARGGAIAIAAGGVVNVDGNVLSGPSRTFLSTRLYGGAALDGGTSNTIGGSITVSSSTFAEPALLVGPNANIVSQGADLGAGPVRIDGCGIEVRGLVAALSRKDGVAQVSIRSGKDLLIDGRDLGGTGTRMGRVRADAPSGTALNKGVDLFAAETVNVHGPASGLYVVTSLPGLHDTKSYGGLIRIVSLGDAVNASGNVIDDGHTASGDSGGTVEISAKEDVTLHTAVIRAVGDFNTNNPNRGGGAIRVRSYSGDIIWTNGTGEVRPVGSSSNLPLSDQGSIVLTACGTVNTTGSTFPVMGAATSVFPETHTGVCSPAGPSLPSGVPPLVTCNTPPVANDASAATHEDNAVTVTLSGSDADGDSLTFSIVAGPANGTLGPIVPTGPTTATVTYTPNLNFNGADAFVYKADDGNGGSDTATVTISVAPVNDPPAFLAGPSVSALEDSGANAYPNWATSISGGPADEAGQTVTFTVTNDNNALFAVQPALSSNGTLTFTTAANAFGSATITIVAKDNGGTANGGNDTSAPQTSSITVVAVNDEPSFTRGADQSVNEDAGPQTVSPWATSISAGPNEGGQSLTFVVTNDNNALFSAQPAVSSAGTLTYTPAANANGSATVSVTLKDNGGTANAGDDTSSTQTFTISVTAVNDAPSFTSGGNVTVLEDSGAYSAAWATSISAGPADESGQTFSFSASNDNNALFTAQPAISPSGVLTFTVAANAHGSANVTVTLSDNGGTANGGSDTSAPQTFVITITAVNDEPSFTAGGNVTVNEDSGAYSAAWATGISAGPNESSQNVTFSASNDNNALFSAQPSVSPGGVLTFTPAANANGTATVTVYLTDDGGTANGGDDTSSTQTFTITVTAVNDEPSFTSGGNVSVLEDSGSYSAAWATGISAGPANESGQSVTFTVTNDNNGLFSAQPSLSPSGVLTFTVDANAFGSATVSVTLKDDGGTANGGDDTSATVTFTITVEGVNDAPSFTQGGDVSVNENSGAYSAPWATAISAGPGESGQTVTFNTSNDNNALFSVQPSINSAGTLSFTPAPNAFGTATVSVFAKDNGGTANGGADTSATVTFVITVIESNDPPVANADAWETEGNTELRVDHGTSLTPHVFDTTPSGTGVLHNDTDPDGDPVVVSGVVGCADTAAPFVCAVTGGTVTLQSDGSFTFVPNAGATGGGFQYTITDQPSAGVPASATGSVTLTIHDMIWYVNGAAPAGGDGTSVAPFNNFAPLNGTGDVDAPGAYIFVHASAVSGSMVLEASQKFWGEGVGLIIPRNLNGNGAPTTLVAPGTKPVMTASGDAVLVSDVTGVEVAGLSIVTASGNGIDVTSSAAATGAKIYSNSILASGSEGIDINAGSAAGTTVAINATDVTAMANAVDLSATGGDVVFAYSNGTVTSITGHGIVADGSGADSFVVNGLTNVTVSGNTVGNGVVITSARFDANASTAAVETLSGGAMAAGTSADPVGGAAVTLTNVSGDLAFTSLSAHGTTNGVTVTGTGLYTGSAGMQIASGGGSITGGAGAGTGVGLSVTNASIGSANLTFTSISADGAANGILLNNTGSAGGLKVVGSGSAGSGGTIENTTADGVSLRSTSGVSLAWMNVQNTAHNGIAGTGVVGFAFANGSVSGAGTAAAGASKESGIAFNESATFTENNLSGAVSITGSSISNARRHGIDLTNWAGTLSSVAISNNTITSTTSTATSLGHAILILSQGSASGTANITKADILNNQITNFPSGSGIFVGGGSTSSSTPFTIGVPNTADAVTISGNRISGASSAVRMGSNAIQVSANGCNGQANFVITNNGTVANPLTNFAGLGISHFIAGTVNATALIDGNVIVANNTAGSPGIATQVDAACGVGDAAVSVVTITNNRVSGTEGNGIRAIARASNGTLNAAVKNNVVGTPTLANRNGIRVDSGSGSGDVSLCLDIANNTASGSGVSKGIGLRKQGTNATVNSFGVVGMGATSSPGVENYVNTQNPSGGGTELISATSGFTNCSL